MITIEDGRRYLYQWDLDRFLLIDNPKVVEVQFHISSKVEDLICEVFEKDGKRVVPIPNIILQKSGKFRVYACGTGYTIEEQVFEIKYRNQPKDYEYTETEVLKDKVAALVDLYFAENTFVLDANQ